MDCFEFELIYIGNSSQSGLHNEILSRKTKQTNKTPIGSKVDLCESVVSGWLYFAKKPKAVLLFSILGPNEGREKQSSICSLY